jgi:hypothetical protein
MHGDGGVGLNQGWNIGMGRLGKERERYLKRGRGGKDPTETQFNLEEKEGGSAITWYQLFPALVFIRGVSFLINHYCYS